jgi:xanthine permease XanP
MLVPELLSQTPKLVQSILGSPVTMAGVTALTITSILAFLPSKQTETASELASAES